MDEGSAWNRDLYLNYKYNIHKEETPMHLAGFEPAIPAGEQPQTNALACAVTGIG